MLENLFSPLKTKNLELKNRVVLSPMGVGSYNDDETITQDYIDFIKARSTETGLIVTTGTRVTKKYGEYKLNGCYDKKFIPGLSLLSAAAKKNNSKIVLQILALGPADPFKPFVPSLNIPEYRNIENSQIKPLELTIEQIEELENEFINAAAIAQQSGFDGIELFGSEDGLISSFICPHFNKRSDKYGGSLENMLKFPVNIIRGIKRLCGNDFIIGFKFNTIYNISDGIDIDLGIKISKQISKEGISYIHCWSFETFERPMSTYKYSPMPNLYQPRNTLTAISQKIKGDLIGTPVMVVGGILKPDEADSIISRGEADLVAVGRAFIAENFWSYNAKSNKLIRPCIRCHECHNEVAVNGNIISCSVNPDVFLKNIIKKTPKPLEISVVGAGPAGITAAVTAAKRGHHVKLFEKENRIGGKVIFGSAPDFKHEFKDLLHYFEETVNKEDIEIIRDFEVNESTFSENVPDKLILAIGAETLYPDIPGIQGSNVFDAIHALNKPDSFIGKNIAVIGGGDVGCETALFLKLKGSRSVAVIEVMDGLMKSEISHNSVILEKMLVDENVNIYTDSFVNQIREECIIFNQGKSNNIKSLNIDYVIIATGYKVPEKKVEKFKSLKTDLNIIGDCLKPHKLKDAISSGYNLGINI